ncbi:MAG: prolipoprotein diacylglyceryl transferase [Chloroflexi bacterium]|nr:prolipoprotein diacylglyceryl transferase [Chloroflexota bacterium]
MAQAALDWVGTSLGLSVLTGYLIFGLRVSKPAGPPQAMHMIAVLSVIGGLVGAYLGGVVMNLGTIIHGLVYLVAIRPASFSLYSGLLGGGVVWWVLCRRARVDPWYLLDVATFAVVQGIVAVRVVQFALRTRLGLPADVLGGHYHPVALYDAGGALAALALAWTIGRRKGSPLMPVWLLFYSGLRCIVTDPCTLGSVVVPVVQSTFWGWQAVTGPQLASFEAALFSAVWCTVIRGTRSPHVIYREVAACTGHPADDAG